MHRGGRGSGSRSPLERPFRWLSGRCREQSSTSATTQELLITNDIVFFDASDGICGLRDFRGFRGLARLCRACAEPLEKPESAYADLELFDLGP